MCTAITYKTRGAYFGRTLDYDRSFGEEIVITPRRYPLFFRRGETFCDRYAIIGMARVEEGYPLYFDGMNERGLYMAGLNFTQSARYAGSEESGRGIAQFNLIPYILCSCATLGEARERLSEIDITDEPFSKRLPVARLHWMVADEQGAITVEAIEGRTIVYDNPVGVLTNEPPFDIQMQRLNDYMQLSPESPKNLFSDKLDLSAYSRGMGALGLPGDLSSASRFVRAAFVKLNSVSDKGEEESVSQFFHILGSVEQTRGCCRVDDGYEITRYSSCCSAERGIYYYTTYENRSLSAVDMTRAELDGETLERYPLLRKERIYYQNADKN